MKRIPLIVIGIVLLASVSLPAQVSLNINIGTPPPWGPAGYSQVNYYYLPDVEAYYDVRARMFIYFGGQTWVHRPSLPSRHQGYDLYSGYKVVMHNYHGNKPYTHFKEHKMKYARGHYHGKIQKTVGNRPGKGNPGGGDPHKYNPGKNNGGNDKQNGHGKNNSGKKDHGNGHGNGKK